MMAQVLLFDIFSEKDPHFNAVECYRLFIASEAATGGVL